ncbi:hypothetical protein QUF49_16470 [Fictibacillus sp. b24]|uniref:hypothetical protein n=1 Tax=Fictibacillus sp. b24 TaxID=3055863 RepID=UPI0025A268A7|nr:hypothetical protein [Fictibacillus sp. b24]MDM5317607.1 hypothetical protein [Fictibacillus sp. b24]
MERKVADSYGTSGQVESPNGAKQQEAHLTPRRKRATWRGNQQLIRTTEVTVTAFL